MSKEDDFLSFVRRKCAQLNVNFRIGKGRTVLTPDREPSDGYFVEPDKNSPGELAVARKCDNFLLTLAHEYTHMLQWFREDPILHGDYYLLEKKTERDALKILQDFGINKKKRIAAQRKSKDYLKWLKENR